MSDMTRRRFGAITGGLVGSLLGGGGCHSGGEVSGTAAGRLAARPLSNVATSAAPGARLLGLDRSRDAILYVPGTTDALLPLLVLFHGAGGSGERLLRRFMPEAETAGVALLAPDSRASTWDAIGGSFGRDVAFVDRALERVFATVAVDSSRVGAGGFSDGATYALSLGLINGDLFHTVIACSPGFVVDGPMQGTPKIFVSHGTEDQILPINRCSRVIVPALRRRGYDVTFREFEGGHEVPAEIAREGLRLVAGGG
jgi:phospholipase/carboxylesterase